MVLFSQNNVCKCHLPYSPVYTVTYNPCRVTSMSFPLVSVFSGRQLGEYLLNQVTSTKILVAMAQKVVAASLVGCCAGSFDVAICDLLFHTQVGYSPEYPLTSLSDWLGPVFGGFRSRMGFSFLRCFLEQGMIKLLNRLLKMS